MSSANLGSVAGQIAVVTGGSKGIGRALAEGLAAAGAAVAVVARSPEQANEAASAITAAGGSAIAIAADVSDRRAVTDLVTKIQTDFGPIDLLVNNAGVITPLGPLAETDPDDWWRCLEINVRGSLLCSHAILAAMCANGRGRIINMTSLAGIAPVPFMSAYLVSKVALMRLNELMALEARPHGVKVFSVSPGAIRTDMVATLTETAEGAKWTPWASEQLASVEIPIERVVSLVLTIASGAADELSGRVINAREDFKQVIARAAEVEHSNLYTLRMETLQGMQTSIWKTDA